MNDVSLYTVSAGLQSLYIPPLTTASWYSAQLVQERFLRQTSCDKIVGKKKNHLFIEKGSRNRKSNKELEHCCLFSASASLFVLGELALSNKVSLY